MRTVRLNRSNGNVRTLQVDDIKKVEGKEDGWITTITMYDGEIITLAKNADDFLNKVYSDEHNEHQLIDIDEDPLEPPSITDISSTLKI